MRLDDILTTLTPHHIKIRQLGNPQMNITDLEQKSWTELDQQAQDGLFYVMTGACPEAITYSDKEFALLCVAPADTTNLVQQLPHATILLAQDEKHLQSVRAAIQQELHQNYVALERLSEAYHATFSGTNFQQLSAIGSHILGNPVFILDNLGNYIAFPPLDVHETDTLQEERKRGHILKEDLAELKRLKIDQILKETGKAYLFENPILQHNTLVDFIRLNGSVLGRLMTYDRNRPITDEDRIVFMHFSRIVALAFTQDRNYLMNKESAYSYFLQALVNRDNAAIAVGNAQIEEMKLNVQQFKRVLLISFMDEQVSETNRLVIAQQLQNLLGNALYMFRDNKLVFLVSSSRKDFLQKKMSELLSFCQITNLRLSCSHIFYDFNLFRQMFQQASQVDNIVQKYNLTGNLFSYRYLDSLITLDLHRSNYPVFVHPDILELLHHDREKKSQLLMTLATYILFNQDIEAMSAYLYLHANTLRYRIKQIQKLLHSDLKDWLLLKTYYDSLIQLFQMGDIANQDLIIKYDAHFL